MCAFRQDRKILGMTPIARNASSPDPLSKSLIQFRESALEYVWLLMDFILHIDQHLQTLIADYGTWVIMSNDTANRHTERVVVIPVTSNTGRQYPGEAIVSINGQSSKAMADQIMSADKSRLKDRRCVLSKTDMLAVEDAVKVHLALPK